MYQMALKRSNVHKIYQRLPLQNPSKFTQIAILVRKYTIWQTCSQGRKNAPYMNLHFTSNIGGD
jgi:hypothetical protein